MWKLWYKAGVARLFCSRAKFERYFYSRAAIFFNQNFFWAFFTIFSFLMIIEGKYNLQFKYLVMIKRLAGRKNKLAGRMATPDIKRSCYYHQAIPFHSRSEDRHRHLYRLDRLHRVERRLLGPRCSLLHAPERRVEPGQPRDKSSCFYRTGSPARRLQHLLGRRPPLRLRRLRT